MKPKFFELAKKLSYKSDYHTHKLGAVVVKGNKLLGFGFNQRKSHPKSLTRFRNIHAELSAILSCSTEDFSGCAIYVYRENRQGELATSRPCQHCQQLLRSVGIKKVYYTTESGYKEEEFT